MFLIKLGSQIRGQRELHQGLFGILSRTLKAAAEVKARRQYEAQWEFLSLLVSPLAVHVHRMARL